MKRTILKSFSCAAVLLVSSAYPGSAKAQPAIREATKEDYAASDAWWEKQAEILRRLGKEIRYVDGKEILVDVDIRKEAVRPANLGKPRRVLITLPDSTTIAIEF